MIDTELHTHPHIGCQNCDDRNYNPDKPRLKDLLWYNHPWLVEAHTAGKIRDAVLDNVEKALLCNTMYLGYDGFECPVCGNFNIICHKCHSRVCTSCGVKMQRTLALQAETMCLDVPHRHMVFTIPKEYRNIFRKNRDSLDLLFIAARNTVVKVFNESLYRKIKNKRKKTGKFMNKKDNTYFLRNHKNANVIGMIATLHTFGRALNWNPHIHCLVAEAFYDPKSKKMKRITYMDFKSLRYTWQYELNRLITLRFKNEYRHLTSRSFTNQENGFYVYAKAPNNEPSKFGKSNSANVRGCVNYMMRYAARPAMAESRLTHYDKKNQTVQWFYMDHKTDKRIDVKESALDLFKKIIIHIPEPNFVMVRYYGFYNNKKQDLLNKMHDDLESSNTKEEAKKRKSTVHERILAKKKSLRCRTMMLDSFNRDILLCPCGTVMKYVDTYDPLEGNTNDRAYRQNCITKMREMWLHRGHPPERH